MSAPTKGPWSVHERIGYYVLGPDGQKVANTGASRPDVECFANSRLIAAAPDMLIALQAIKLKAPSLYAVGIRAICDEAIAKATGEPS